MGGGGEGRREERRGGYSESDLPMIKHMNLIRMIQIIIDNP